MPQSKVTFKGQPINLVGNLPSIGSATPPCTLVRKDLSEAKLSDFKGKKIVMNIFPSLDTSVCAMALKRFHELLAEQPQIQVLNISMDLPFAMGRFCAAESLPTAETLSAFRSTFGVDYGVTMSDGPLKGLLARSVLILDEQGKVMYAELVPEITQEPDYSRAAAALGLQAHARK